MEGITKINQKIMKEAITEANKIISDAKEKTTELRKTEKEKINAEKSVIKETGKKNADREQQRILSSTNLEAHNIHLRSRDNTITSAIEKAETQLDRMAKQGTGRYKTALKILAKEGIDAIGENSKLCFNQENEAYGKELAQELKSKLGKTVEIAGGVIIESADGNLKIDNSIERIMERDSEKIRGDVAAILFKNK
ncbi:MAG: V-type ATP synthase subunit E family protein [Candidatus Undinarchaeales archaeon]|jgi:V/A-type H+-transporting ATPase subunit E|nr:V-type ATP synthase subunit E family protein [Candidatus Undinarchaeales archaeon]